MLRSQRAVSRFMRQREARLVLPAFSSPTTPLLFQTNNNVNVQQKRDFLHLPPFLAGATMAPKLLAILAMKKVVLVAIIKNYGIGRTFQALRDANNHAFQVLGQQKYPALAKQSVDVGINTLENLVNKMDVEQQADAILNWLKQLDPSVLRVVANDLLKASAGALKSIKDRVASDEPKITIKPNNEEQSLEEQQANEMIQLILKRVPEVKSKYMVVLIEKK